MNTCNSIPQRSMQAIWMARTCLVLLLLCTMGGPHAQSPGTVPAGAFSSSGTGEGLPKDWQPLSFRRIERQTRYSLIKDDGTVVIKAVSDRSASGLIRPITIDSAEYPVIEWRWKVNNLLRKGDVSRKEGDDYPARIYITFAFDPDRAGYLERLKQKAARLLYGKDTPYRAIAYVWGSNSPAGTMIENPYTNRTMMFVVQSGDGKLQQWVTERRDVHADYRKAFGEEPPMISGVAIMTDSDDTGESAVAWYGDIVFTNSRRDRPTR